MFRFLNKSIALMLAAACAACVLGCHPHLYAERPNPYGDIKVFAVAPIIGVSERKISAGTEALEDGFADELISFPEVENVIRASTVLKVMEKLKLDAMRTADDALKVLREVKADALIVMEVENVNLLPHDMRVTVHLQMFTVRKYEPGEVDFKAFDMARRPFALTEDFGRRPIVGFQKSFVTSNRDTRERIDYYASAHDTSKRGLGDEVYIRVFREFFRFVSYEMILEIWQREIDRLQRLAQPAGLSEGEPE
jgi:hypothetical protein